MTSETRSDPFGTFGAMLSSDSPGDFAAQASIIDVVSSRRSAVLTEATKASTAAAKAASDAKAAQAAAAKLTTELAAKRTDLSARAAQSKAMFDRLSAAERQSFLDSQPQAAADRASRSDSRTPGRARRAAGERAGQRGRGDRGRGGQVQARQPVRVGGSRSVHIRLLGPDHVRVGRGRRSSLPHSSAMQMSSGPGCRLSALQPGDLVFYGSPVHHVALYVGGGQVIHAPQTGDVVRYASVDMMPIAGAVRP